MSTICEFKKRLYIYISNNNKNKDKMEANYRIQTAEGKLKYTGGTEIGSWFFLKDARALVDYSKGEKIVKEIVFGVYTEIM